MQFTEVTVSRLLKVNRNLSLWNFVFWSIE